MTEYIRKQDAVDAIKKRFGCNAVSSIIAESVIDELKPADVVKIIRCKNCQYRSYDEVFYCYWCEHEGMVREVKPDFYCGYGEE